MISGSALTMRPRIVCALDTSKRSERPQRICTSNGPDLCMARADLEQ